MKKILGFMLAMLMLNISFSQTATNFVASDCASNSHTLFTELDAGKVVVICWVMPCATCIGPASTDANTVLGFANPNVVFYMVDDAGNTSCSTLGSWANTNSIAANAIFSNTGNTINMANYGTAAMPKTIVVGGTNHAVFYNVDETVNQSDLQAAINSALSATTGIAVNKNSKMDLAVFPNPASVSTKIKYSLSETSDIKIEIRNLLGESVNTNLFLKQSPGPQEYDLNVESLDNGIYLVELKINSMSKVIKLSIAK